MFLSGPEFSRRVTVRLCHRLGILSEQMDKHSVVHDLPDASRMHPVGHESGRAIPRVTVHAAAKERGDA